MCVCVCVCVCRKSTEFSDYNIIVFNNEYHLVRILLGRFLALESGLV